MSVILRPRTAQSLGTRNRTGRELAAVVTCGAAVLVLVLAAAIPVAAEKATDTVQREAGCPCPVLRWGVGG
jgi:hypothetical protein